jgi:hypothetical protein
MLVGVSACCVVDFIWAASWPASFDALPPDVDAVVQTAIPDTGSPRSG